MDPSQPKLNEEYPISTVRNDRIVVRFKKDALQERADCIFRRGEAFVSKFSGGKELDEISHAVREMKPLYRVARSNQTCGAAALKTSLKQRGWHDVDAIGDTFILTLKDAKVSTVFEMVNKLKNIEGVMYAQPDYAVATSFTPNDPLFFSQSSWGQSSSDLWALKSDKMNLQPAWDVSMGGGVVVAVVDTGVSAHSDLDANRWTNPLETINGLDDDANGFIDDIYGWNFYSDTSNPQDGHGHGTHVAGTIAAVGNNGIGMIGIAPAAKIMAVKGLSNGGGGYISDLADGIVYAAQMGAKVINNSWGCNSPCPSDPVAEDAVRAATAAGAVVVFAAGNSNNEVFQYSPQNMPEVVTVASSTANDRRSDFSQYGMMIDVAAPGSGEGTNRILGSPFWGILSLSASGSYLDTYYSQNIFIHGGTRYLRLAGTSMAAPHVTGLAALIKARWPNLSPNKVRMALKMSADDIDGAGFDILSGSGRINAASAMTLGAIPSLQIKTTDPAENSYKKIFYPAQGETELKIAGTINGSTVNNYQVLMGKGFNPNSWQPVGSGSLPVGLTPGGLALGNGFGLMPIADLFSGIYTLRLQTTTSDGYKIVDHAQFGIERSYPVATEPIKNRELQAATGRYVLYTEETTVQNQYQLVLHDQRTNQKTIIDTNNNYQIFGKLSNDFVAYVKFQSSGDYYQFWIYNIATGVITPYGSISNLSWDVSGSRLVYLPPYVYGSIRIVDLVTGQGDWIYSGVNDGGNRIGDLDISDQKIAWTKITLFPLTTQIFMHDLATSTTRAVTAAYTGDSIDYEGQVVGGSQISGNLVVWKFSDYDNSEYHNYALNLQTDSVHETPMFGHLAGSKLVYRNGYNIFTYDIVTENGDQASFKQNASANSFNDSPMLANHSVFWLERDWDGNSEHPQTEKIWGTALPKNVELTMTTNPASNGTVDFQVKNLANKLQVVDSWYRIYRLDGTLVETGPRHELVLPANATISNTLPLNLGKGMYRVEAYLGAYPDHWEAEATLQFTVGSMQAVDLN